MKGFHEGKHWSFKSKRNPTKRNELKFKSERFWLDNDNFVSSDDRVFQPERVGPTSLDVF